MNQLIYFDSLRLEHDNQDFKPKLYDLFFKWRKDIHKNQEEDLEKIEEPARKQDQIEKMKSEYLK